MTSRPNNDEYAAYYEKYVSKVPDGDIIDTLIAQNERYQKLFAHVPADRKSFSYAPGKWTLNESLLHVADTERVFAYRALRIARGDTISLHGFEQDDWVPLSGANARATADLVAEFAQVRAATIALFEGLPADAWTRRGTASNNPVTVRALAYICAGHAQHHEQLFAEKYL